jgi:hypothetical protein
MEFPKTNGVELLKHVLGLLVTETLSEELTLLLG